MFRIFLLIATLLLVINIFKYIKPEYAYLFRLLSICAVFVPIVSSFGVISDYLSGFSDTGGINIQFVNTALKISALTLCSQTVAELCRDCHESALASAVEIVGRISVLTVSLPIIRQLIQFGEEILK